MPWVNPPLNPAPCTAPVANEVCCNASATDTKPFVSMSKAVMTVTGVEISARTWGIRDPVTTTSSSVESAAAPLLAPAARTGCADMINATAADKATKDFGPKTGFLTPNVAFSTKSPFKFVPPLHSVRTKICRVRPISALILRCYGRAIKVQSKRNNAIPVVGNLQHDLAGAPIQHLHLAAHCRVPQAQMKGTWFNELKP